VSAPKLDDAAILDLFNDHHSPRCPREQTRRALPTMPEVCRYCSEPLPPDADEPIAGLPPADSEEGQRILARR
jgi:hypothetical protein